MVFGNTLSQRCGSDRREHIESEWKEFPRIHYIGNSRRDSKDDNWIKVWSWSIQKKDHFQVDVQWHWLGKTRKQRRWYCECSQSHRVCSKIHARTMVVSRAWVGEEMVRNSCQQAWWRVGENCWRHDAPHCRKQTSCVPCYLRTSKRKIREQRKRVTSNHFNGNQLSVYEAVADVCEELAKDSRGTEKPAANENLESMVVPTEFLSANPTSQTDAEVHVNTRRQSQNFLNNKNWPNSTPMLVSRRSLRKDDSSWHLNVDTGKFSQGCC